MVSDQAIWGKRIFPAFSLSLWTKMRSALFAQPSRVVAAGLLLALIGGAGLAYLGQRAVHDARLLANEEAAERGVERANLALSKKLAVLEDKLGEATRMREAAERRLAALAGQSGLLRGLLLTAQTKLDTLDRAQSALSDEAGTIERQLAQSQRAASSKQSRIASLRRALGNAQKALHQAQAERATLSARFARLEAEQAKEKGHEAEYRASLQRWARELQQAITERDRLKTRLGQLGQKLSQGGVRRPQQKVASAPAAGALRIARARADSGGSAVAQFKQVLASTGLDVRRLFAKFGANSAEGGPFVPPPRGGKLPGQLDAKQLAVLRRVAKALPLSLPLNHFRLTSPFGLRRGPFRGRKEFHTGDDLAAPYMSPVYSPAAGTVVYAGWMPGGYGKVVEINDGNGVSTLFAHLHRYTVLVGEHVAAHTQIGYIGTTGRATGPHLHYEIRVNGHPQDPMKFVTLGRLLPAAAR
jgi:murein DD-endopeptidase MepM/ murein hydrolase activator NlpD